MKSKNKSRSGFIQVCLVALLALGTACTSAQESTSEASATVPGAINSDADRRAIYNQGSVSRSPSSLPRNLNDQASETNRKKNIEERGTEKPHNKPLEVRTRELGRPPRRYHPAVKTKTPDLLSKSGVLVLSLEL